MDATLSPALAEPTQVQLNASVVTDANGFALTCKDASDGQINVTASGGNTPTTYTYTLIRSGDPVNPFRVITAASASESFQGLPFGSYTITATDQFNCPSQPVSIIIVNPPPFIAGLIGINQSICIGEDPQIINELVPPFGGVGDYQFQWQQSLSGLPNEWIDIPGAIGTTFDPPAITLTTYYRRLVFSGTPPPGPRTFGPCQWLGHDNPVEVTVNPLPTSDFTAPSVACEGDIIALDLVLTLGTAPIEYDYTVGSTSYINNPAQATSKILVGGITETTTFTLTRLKDFNGCLANDVPKARVVPLTKINSDFAILDPSEQCSGGTFTFRWTAEPGIRYTWDWNDGSASQLFILDASILVPKDTTITHVFTTSSSATTVEYPVRLNATHPICGTQVTTKAVKVFPNVVLNILPGELILCSGESTRFRDQSAGVDIGK